MALNVCWSVDMTNVELYGDLPKVSQKIRVRRLKLSGRWVRHLEELASNLILWQPSLGWAKGGRKKTTYVDNLLQDTNIQRAEEWRSLMIDRETWKVIVRNCQNSSGCRPG